MQLKCDQCGSSLTLPLPKTYSSHYETTFSEFLQILKNLDRYVEIKLMLQETFNIRKVSVDEGLVYVTNEKSISFESLHERIQLDAKIQKTLYNRRMDVDR